VKIFLVVKVTDVNYNPLKGCTINVDFGSAGGLQTAKPAGPDGTFEVLTPNQTDVISVTVKKPPHFFAADQRVKIIRGKGSQNPSLIFTPNGSQNLNTVKLGGNSRATGDFNLEIYFALGQLTDGRAPVELVKNASAGSIQTLDPVSRHVIDFNGPTVVNPAATAGWSLLRQAPLLGVTPKGKMFYARRIDIPELIAIWVPEGVLVSRQRNDNVDPSTKPLNFHIFYHPNPGVLHGSYPFSFAFVDLICRYLFYYPNLHKEMVNQHAAAGVNNIFVFPVGDPKKWNGTLGGQNSVLWLLQEVAFFVQRMALIPIPLQKVGKCAISGFSASGPLVQKALKLENAFFDQHVLREVYGFDLRGAEAQTFANSLIAWRGRNAKKDADPRKFRIYTTDESWFTANRHVDRTATSITGPAGSLERSGPNSSVVYLPISPFWTSLNPTVTGDGKSADKSAYTVFKPVFVQKHDDVHQMMPVLFMEHALKNSQFK
jgi:hypothetical protein